jgi:hypothetical protein
MQAPHEPVQLSLDECMQTTWRKQSSYISSTLTGQTSTTGQTGAQHVNRTSPLTGQTGDTQSPEMARNHMKTFQMHSMGQNKLKLLPLLTMHESSQS